MPNIIFENDHIVVLDKPSGMLVHESEEESSKNTVVAWFLSRCPEAREVGEPGRAPSGKALLRSGVVHRLDRETSGIMVMAKTQEAFEHLKHQFQSRSIYKEYRAFVYGTMTESWGVIDRPIGRNSKDWRIRSAQRGAKGMLRPAVTEWELIGQSTTHAYLKLMPKTGRTHQLRAHLKAINHPIVADQLYAPNHEPELGFTRLALHAHILGFELPGGEVRRFMSPLPHEFTVAADQMAEDA